MVSRGEAKNLSAAVKLLRRPKPAPVTTTPAQPKHYRSPYAEN
jgi:hypothetical protein